MRKICYILILALELGSCSNPPEVIGIQTLGAGSKRYVDSVHAALDRAYPFEIRILPHEQIPEHTYTYVKVPRYRADQLIKYLKEQQPKDVDITIGLISKDISTTKRDAHGNIKKPESKYADWGIFGLGYRPGPSCIISTHRLHGAGEKKFYERLQKIAIHEVGHNLGLRHCPNEGCVMQDAVETIATVDRADPFLCDSCLRVLEYH